MKATTLYTIVFFLSGLLFSFQDAAGQGTLRLPQVSPQSVTTQTLGLTDITVSYFRPSVKGRKIFGDLVPYGKLWRTGANNATTITFSDDVIVNGEHIPAGAYSLFTVPDAESWAVILNRDTTIWGTEGYQESGDLMRLTVTPEKADFTETLLFTFSDISTNKAKLNLYWENTKVSLPLEVEVEASVLREIKKSLANAGPDNWQIYAQAANYYVQLNKNHELALQWVNKSLAIKQSYYNNWVKARLLAQKTEYKEALALAKKTMKLGEAEGGSYTLVKADIAKAIEQWKAKQHL